MSHENRPAFLLYASDWTTGTADMSLEEQGIYMKLLCQQWLKGGLPTDIDRICKLVFGPESASDSLANRKRIEFVLQKFRLQIIDGREVLANDRLESIRASERTKFENRSNANSENARKPRKKKAEPDSDSFSDLAKEERFANDSLTKTQRKEDEDEYRNESENEDENRGVQGGETRFAHRMKLEEFRAALSDFRQVYNDTDGEAKTGNAYREALEMLMAQGWEFMDAVKMLRYKAAEYRAYLHAVTRSKLDACNWLKTRCWENDYHAKLIEEQERRKIDNGSYKTRNPIGDILTGIAGSSDI